jgi:hypothetical protein
MSRSFKFSLDCYGVSMEDLSFDAFLELSLEFEELDFNESYRLMSLKLAYKDVWFFHRWLSF